MGAAPVRRGEQQVDVGLLLQVVDAVLEHDHEVRPSAVHLHVALKGLLRIWKCIVDRFCPVTATEPPAKRDLWFRTQHIHIRSRDYILISVMTIGNDC